MADPFALLRSRRVLAEKCEIHGCELWEIQIPLRGRGGESRPHAFCPECAKEDTERRQRASHQAALMKHYERQGYAVLMRDSVIPEKLKSASFDNFVAEADEERRLLTFCKGQAQKYLDGMTGNTFVTGGTGIGKTHLSIAMAKAINDGFRDKCESRSVLFANLTEIIKRVKEGWSYGSGAKLTEQAAVKLLTRADYLILDDLGAKNADVRPKSDWEQDFLFDVLNNRSNTIVNSNLSLDELRLVYNERNFSRLLEGLSGNAFAAKAISDKRYGLRELEVRRVIV